eukprot:GILK01001131.1.p1 GENE.GILK01001131.1~~GILK01001131.1.p1  ORF type:complete len:466 (-),score=55.61 GILK01001131.1:126-1523(-)
MVRVADTGWRCVRLVVCAQLLLSSCLVSAVRQDLFSQFQPSSLGFAAKPSAIPITATPSQQKLQEQSHQWRFVQSKETKSWRMTPMSPSASPQVTLPVSGIPLSAPSTPSSSSTASSVSSLLSQFVRNKDGSSPPLVPTTSSSSTTAIPSLLSAPTSFTLLDGNKDTMLEELQKTVGTLTDVVSNDWRHPEEKPFVGASDAAGVLTDIRNFDPMTSTQLLSTSVPLLTTPLAPQASPSSFLELEATNPMLGMAAGMAGPAAGMAMGAAPMPGAAPPPAAGAPKAAAPGAAPAGTAPGTAADGSSTSSGSSANGPSNGAPPSSWWLPPAPAMPVMPYMGLMHYPYPAMSPMSPTLGSGMSMPMGGAPYMPAPPPGYVPPYPGYARPPFAYGPPGYPGYPGPAAYAPYGSPPAFPYTPPPSVQTSVATPFPTAGALGYPPVTISVHYPGYYSFKEKQAPRLHPGDSV